MNNICMHILQQLITNLIPYSQDISFRSPRLLTEAVVVIDSPRLKTTFKKAKKVEKSAFLGPLMYALVREACRSLISDSCIVSRTHKLPRFTHKVLTSVSSNEPINGWTDRVITLPLLRKRKR